MSMNQTDAAHVAAHLSRMAEPGLGNELRESLLRVVAHLNAQITRMNQPLFNPPAFPRDHAQDGHNGMDLRDHFAANALPGLLARAWSDPATGKTPDNVHELWAIAAYATADAMLRERDK